MTEICPSSPGWEIEAPCCEILLFVPEVNSKPRSSVPHFFLLSRHKPAIKNRNVKKIG